MTLVGEADFDGLNYGKVDFGQKMGKKGCFWGIFDGLNCDFRGVHFTLFVL